jgi:hypothetical protein
VDGPGGTGKTFLYKALLARVQSKGLIAIATATSGIAASILQHQYCPDINIAALILPGHQPPI